MKVCIVWIEWLFVAAWRKLPQCHGINRSIHHVFLTAVMCCEKPQKLFEATLSQRQRLLAEATTLACPCSKVCRVRLVVFWHPEMMDAALNAKEIFNIVINPELEHLRYLDAEIRLEHFLDCEVEDRRCYPECITRDPVNRLRLRISSRNQSKSIRVFRQCPDGEARCGVINENPSLGLLHNAEKDRK